MDSAHATSAPPTRARASSPRRWHRALRWLHPVVLCLAFVWVLGPDDRTRVFRDSLIASYALLIAVAITSRRSSRLAAAAGRLVRPLRWLDVAVVNLIAAVLLAELVFGAIAAATSSPFFATEDVGAAERIRLQRYRPGGWHNGHLCNELGFVDEPFARARVPGTRRIVALGDSFSVAVVPYAQNYLTLLDDALDATTQTEVLNFGVTGIGPAEYLHLWRTEARHFDPDLVLVAFFVGNDFVEHKRRSILHPRSLRIFSVPFRLWRMATSGMEPGAAADLGVMPEDLPTYADDVYLRIERERAQICATTPDPRRDVRIRQTFDLLGALHEDIGSRLRVVIIPDEFQVDDALWQRVVDGSPATFDRERPNRDLAAQLRELGVPFLDLLDVLRNAATSGRTYKLRDGHWNARGNAAAATAIATWLGAQPWPR